MIDKYFENGKEVFIRIPYETIQGYGIVVVDKEDFAKYKDAFLNECKIIFTKRRIDSYRLDPIVAIVKNGEYVPPYMHYRIMGIETKQGPKNIVHAVNNNFLDLRKRNLIVITQSDIANMKRLSTKQIFEMLHKIDNKKVELRIKHLLDYQKPKDELLQKVNELEKIVKLISKELGIDIKSLQYEG